MRVRVRACRVYVLDGGLPAWKAAGLPVEAGEVAEEALKAATHAARAPPAGGSKYCAALDASKAGGRDGQARRRHACVAWACMRVPMAQCGLFVCWGNGWCLLW